MTMTSYSVMIVNNLGPTTVHVEATSFEDAAEWAMSEVGGTVVLVAQREVI